MFKTPGMLLKRKDVTNLDMSVYKIFNGDDVLDRIATADKSAVNASDYIIENKEHNLVEGITDTWQILHTISVQSLIVYIP